MLDTRKQTALSDTIASQLVSHDHSRHILQPRQQPPQETLGSIGIAPVLNKDVEHNAVLIHGAPEIVLHALDPEEHLVESPRAAAGGGAGSWRSSGRISCTTAARSHRRRQRLAQPEAAQHHAG
jgi:hypothetical protein